MDQWSAASRFSPTTGPKTLRRLGHGLPAETLRATKVDRKSTRLNSSHTVISYAVFCLKKKRMQSHALDATSRRPHVRPLGLPCRRLVVARETMNIAWNRMSSTQQNCSIDTMILRTLGM